MRIVTGRGLFYGLAAAGMFAASAAQAEVRCSSAAEQDAFDVGALKSEMIVLAESCPDTDASYNAFIERYRAELNKENGVVAAWFKRTYGKSAQREMDVYTTDLINQQSQIGLKQGTNFCPRTRLIFAEAMSLPDASVLAEYAAAKQLEPPELGSCSSPQGPAAAGRGKAAHPKKR